MQYDVVLIDTPPIFSVGDALALSAHIDAFMLVNHLGMTRRGELHDLRGALAFARCEILGTVLTGASGSDAFGYVAGQYGYGDKGESRAATEPERRRGRRARRAAGGTTIVTSIRSTSARAPRMKSVSARSTTGRTRGCDLAQGAAAVSRAGRYIQLACCVVLSAGGRRDGRAIAARCFRDRDYRGDCGVGYALDGRLGCPRRAVSLRSAYRGLSGLHAAPGYGQFAHIPLGVGRTGSGAVPGDSRATRSSQSCVARTSRLRCAWHRQSSTKLSRFAGRSTSSSSPSHSRSSVRC